MIPGGADVVIPQEKIGPEAGVDHKAVRLHNETELSFNPVMKLQKTEAVVVSQGTEFLLNLNLNLSQNFFLKEMVCDEELSAEVDFLRTVPDGTNALFGILSIDGNDRYLRKA